MIDLEGAPDALSRLAGCVHEMLDEELTAPVEQVRQRDLTLRGIKDIFLVDPHPRQRSLLPAEFVALPRQLFLPGQQRRPRLEPLLSRRHRMRVSRTFRCLHRLFSFGFVRCLAFVSAIWRMCFNPCSQPSGMPSRCSGGISPIARW